MGSIFFKEEIYRTFIYYIYDLIGPVCADDVAFTIMALINLVKQLPAFYLFTQILNNRINFVLIIWLGKYETKKKGNE